MELRLIVRRMWLLLVICLVKESAGLRGPWLTVPSVIRAGDTVTLSCEYDLEGTPLYNIKWYWNGEEFFRYTPEDSPKCKHFMLENIEFSRSGPTQVTIRNVEKAQSGRYACEVSTDAPKFETGSRHATMTVVAPPASEPSMKISHNRVNVGATVSAECSVPGSDPAANITWSINNEELPEGNESVKISPTTSHNEGNLIGVSSKVEIATDRSHFNEGILYLKCEANIYNVWNKTVEMKVEEEKPPKKSEELAIKSMSSQQSQSNQGSGINM